MPQCVFVRRRFPLRDMLLTRRPALVAARRAVPGATTRAVALAHVLAFAFAFAPDAAAQDRPVLSSGALFSGSSGPGCGAGMGMVSEAAYQGGSVAVLAAPVTSLSGDEVRSPVVVGGVSTPDRHRWQLRAGGAVGRAESDCAAWSDRARTWASLSRRFGNSGLALTVANGGLSSIDPSRAIQGVTVGAWRTIGRVRVSLDVRRHSAGGSWWQPFTRIDTSRTLNTSADTIVPFRPDSALNFKNVPDSSKRQVEWRATDVRTRMQWSIGRLALDFTMGGVTGTVVGRPQRPVADSLTVRSSSNRSPLRLWGRADARVAVNSYLEIVGGIAALPYQPVVEGPPRRIAMLGFGITSLPRFARKGSAESPRVREGASASFESLRVDATTVRVRVRVPKASRVELSSELTGWRPVAMQRVDGEWWEVQVQTPSGVYRVNLRIDGGGWTAPPGVPVVRDEFGGQVGLMPIG